MRLCLLALFLLALPALADSTDAEIFQRLKARLSGGGDVTEREIRRVGNKTIELENYISTEMDPKLAATIFSDYGSWASWILPGLNDRPSGGKYMVQLHGLDFEAPDIVLATFSFQIPMFRKPRSARMRVASKVVEGVYTLTGVLQEEEGTFADVKAMMKLYPAPGTPGRCWLYVDGKAQLKSWILYEALPEKLLKREASDRVRIILDNYSKEEQRRRGSEKTARSANKR